MPSDTDDGTTGEEVATIPFPVDQRRYSSVTAPSFATEKNDKSKNTWPSKCHTESTLHDLVVEHKYD